MKYLFSSSIPTFTLSALMASGLVFSSSVQAEIQANQVFFFGDSLTDTGNFLLANPQEPFPTYPFTYPGRFSNGLVWSDYLNNQLGLDPALGFSLTPNISMIPSDGINFSFGGATSSDQNLVPIPGLIGLEQQIDSFVTLKNNGNNSNTVDPDALYLFWSGSNDYLGSFYTPPAIPYPFQSPTTVVDNLVTSLETLAQNGAERILIGNLPDLGLTPLAQIRGENVVNALSSLTNEHNLLLKQSLQALQQNYPNTDFILWDTYSLFNDFFANPQKYGFTDPNVACTDTDLGSNLVVPSLPNFTTCNNGDAPSQLIWWDSQHPTSRTHELIAQSAAKRLNIPEPSSVFSLILVGSIFLCVQFARQK